MSRRANGAADARLAVADRRIDRDGESRGSISRLYHERGSRRHPGRRSPGAREHTASAEHGNVAMRLPVRAGRDATTINDGPKTQLLPA